jgi:UDP-glucuronate 4-epimerase
VFSTDVFNYGKHRRDFTYIDDNVEGVIRALDLPAPPNPNWKSNKPDPGTGKVPRRAYSIVNKQPVELIDYIGALKKALEKKLKLILYPYSLMTSWTRMPMSMTWSSGLIANPQHLSRKA